MTLYSSSFTLKPRYAVNVEYSIPRECGNLISRKSLIVVAPFAHRSPFPTDSVAHSPTASVVKMAARRVGAVRKAAAACDWWCSVNKTFRPGTPKCDEIIPRIQTFSPSEFFIALGNARQDWGKARKAQVRIRSNFNIGRS